MAKSVKEKKEREYAGAFCPHCEKSSAFFLYKPEEFQSCGRTVRYYFGSCYQCKGPAVFLERTEKRGKGAESLARAYPLHRAALSCQLPTIAEQSYAEALRCEEAKAWLACVVMIGRTLEAVCKEHFQDQKGLSVFAGIAKLHEQGLISEQLKIWADELRILRNVGAHATQVTVAEQDAREALDFLRAILENLYDLSPKFAQFKARRRPP